MSQPSLSALDGWDRFRFEAYVKLLLLKSGRQIEEPSDLTEIVEEQAESLDLQNSDSIDVNILSMCDEDKLKRAFLDRLSELVANEKGGDHVSSSLMVEWPDRVEILVAKNNGFKEKNNQNDPKKNIKKDHSVEILETIQSSLREISKLDRRGSSNLRSPFHFTK